MTDSLFTAVWTEDQSQPSTLSFSLTLRVARPDEPPSSTRGPGPVRRPAKRATATVYKLLAALQDFYVWRDLGQPQGVRRHQVPRHAPQALDPPAKLRYLRAVEAWPIARDRALALLPLYAGTRIAEIRALDVADVRLTARKGEIHRSARVRNPGSCPCIPSSARRWPPGLPSVPPGPARTRPSCSPRSAAPG